MNMQSLMAQAKKLQGDMEKISKEIEETTYTGKNNGVLVELTGKNEITKIEILNEETLTDKELVEDMIMLAVNEALEKVRKDKEVKLGKYTNGLGGLF